jgi:hypothetical protein
LKLLIKKNFQIQISQIEFLKGERSKSKYENHFIVISKTPVKKNVYINNLIYNIKIIFINFIIFFMLFNNIFK